MLGHSRALTTLSLGGLVTLAQPSCASSTPAGRRGASPPPYEDLARHYAPVIRQGAITNQDYITAVDFGGDWVGSNNGCRLENQPTGDLSAGVYYSVVDLKTHLRQLRRFHVKWRRMPLPVAG